jgi:hypothetical protein
MVVVKGKEGIILPLSTWFFEESHCCHPEMSILRGRAAVSQNDDGHHLESSFGTEIDVSAVGQDGELEKTVDGINCPYIKELCSGFRCTVNSTQLHWIPDLKNNNTCCLWIETLVNDEQCLLHCPPSHKWLAYLSKIRCVLKCITINQIAPKWLFPQSTCESPGNPALILGCRGGAVSTWWMIYILVWALLSRVVGLKMVESLKNHFMDASTQLYIQAYWDPRMYMLCKPFPEVRLKKEGVNDLLYNDLCLQNAKPENKKLLPAP